jgi:ubiquinone/menaquinone biosynthesis C-methylase UbiE
VKEGFDMNDSRESTSEIESESLKETVHAFWQRQSCGEIYAAGDDFRSQLDAQSRQRYLLEPYIVDFARFHEGAGQDVLEIGVGMGADHLRWAKSGPKSLTGVDLTERAISFTQQRLAAEGLHSKLQTADAENLPFDNDSFDIVYSWGVLHHTPHTQNALDEVCRVLKPGGKSRIMIYHAHAIVGYMLWIRYALLAGRPWRSLADIYATQLESPGTKVYSTREAAQLFGSFGSVKTSTALSVGDLMQGAAGQRHRGPLLTIAKRLWPRWFIKTFLPNHGLFLMIEAAKDDKCSIRHAA